MIGDYEDKRRKNLIESSLKYLDHQNKVRKYDEAKNSKSDFLIYKSEKELLDSHNHFTVSKYNSLKLNSSFAKASGNDFIAKLIERQADDLIRKTPKRGKDE